MSRTKFLVLVLALLMVSCLPGAFERASSTPSQAPDLLETQPPPTASIPAPPATLAPSLPPPESPDSISCDKVSIANPASTYCMMLGYTIAIQETEAGQVGSCQFPDGSSCSEWDFLAGKCGQEFSYCAHQGYAIQTVSEGGDPFSQEHAVCLDSQGNVLGSVSELSGLIDLLNKCGG